MSEYDSLGQFMPGSIWLYQFNRGYVRLYHVSSRYFRLVQFRSV